MVLLDAAGFPDALVASLIALGTPWRDPESEHDCRDPLAAAAVEVLCELSARDPTRLVGSRILEVLFEYGARDTAGIDLVRGLTMRATLSAAVAQVWRAVAVAMGHPQARAEISRTG